MAKKMGLLGYIISASFGLIFAVAILFPQIEAATTFTFTSTVVAAVVVGVVAAIAIGLAVKTLEDAGVHIQL